MLQVDSRAEKYHNMNAYGMVLNNPVNYTDITGDTVDIADELLQKVETHDKDGNERTDLTNAEKQILSFQKWLGSKDGQAFMKAFGAGGKYGTSNVSFKLGLKPKKTGLSGFFESDYSDVFGLTTFGSKSTPESDMFMNGNDKVYDIKLSDLQQNVYLNPEKFDSQSFYRTFFPNPRYTSFHESKHVYMNAHAIKNKLPVMGAGHQLSSNPKNQHGIINLGRKVPGK